MPPGWESNPQPLVQGMTLQSTEPHWPGLSSSSSSFFFAHRFVVTLHGFIGWFLMCPDPGMNLQPWQLTIFYCNILIPINIPKRVQIFPPPHFYNQLPIFHWSWKTNVCKLKVVIGFKNRDIWIILLEDNLEKKLEI